MCWSCFWDVPLSPGLLNHPPVPSSTEQVGRNQGPDPTTGLGSPEQGWSLIEQLLPKLPGRADRGSCAQRHAGPQKPEDARRFLCLQTTGSQETLESHLLLPQCVGECQFHLLLPRENRFWGHSALSSAGHYDKLLSGLLTRDVGPEVSPRYNRLLYNLPSRRRCFRPVCLRKSQPMKQWENPGSIKDVEALPPPPLFKRGGFHFS